MHSCPSIPMSRVELVCCAGAAEISEHAAEAAR
jgi:hypothetical protein